MLTKFFSELLPTAIHSNLSGVAAHILSTGKDILHTVGYDGTQAGVATLHRAVKTGETITWQLVETFNPLNVTFSEAKPYDEIPLDNIKQNAMYLCRAAADGTQALCAQGFECAEAVAKTGSEVVIDVSGEIIRCLLPHSPDESNSAQSDPDNINYIYYIAAGIAATGIIGTGTYCYFRNKNRQSISNSYSSNQSTDTSTDPVTLIGEINSEYSGHAQSESVTTARKPKGTRDESRGRCLVM